VADPEPVERGDQKQALGRSDAVEVALTYTFTFCSSINVNGCRGESGWNPLVIGRALLTIPRPATSAAMLSSVWN